MDELFRNRWRLTGVGASSTAPQNQWKSIVNRLKPVLTRSILLDQPAIQLGMSRLLLKVVLGLEMLKVSLVDLGGKRDLSLARVEPPATTLKTCLFV